MSQKVERKYIDAWIERNHPNAIVKLSLATGIPGNSLLKIRQGIAPKRLYWKSALSEFLGVPLEVLFPLSGEDGDAA